ncbi:uncharacterized protein LOC102477948 [Tupaia chinensis]|uniref:uncharacterized protein LOC102477948 n=1 Tax=Tupaia chinensis TaxID=246437 RepID=UPI0003C9070F|nr:uncharacterized protein LOC102477948 [Tupaia chinensis]
MLLLWALLLCWRLPPQAQGEAQHLLFLRISKTQLKTDISDLLSEHHVLDRLVKMPVTGAAGEGVSVLDHLPFINGGLVKRSSGLNLSLVGDLLSGKTVPELGVLLGTGGLVIEDAQGPEVTLEVLSDSLLQVTLRCKLYLSLQKILRLEVIKNIRIGVRLEQTGNKTQVAFEECHTPPGCLSIKLLEQMGPVLVNEMKSVTSVLDQALPYLLQKIVCPLATNLLNLVLEDLLHVVLPPSFSGPDDFQYFVTTTEFTEEAILMKVQFITPCGPHRRTARPRYLAPQSLPRLAQGSMADLGFGLEVFNDILSCLYTSKEIHVDPRDPTAGDLMQLLSPRELEPGPQPSHQSRGSVGMTISTPEPPTVHPEGHTAMISQLGSVVLLGPSNSSSTSVSWKLLSKAAFSSRNQELQISPNSSSATLVTYPAGVEKKG